MKASEVRAARSELGHLWGLDRHLTVGELARILGMRGDSAGDMVVDYESGRRQPTGPITLALELMREPSDEVIDEAIAALGAISVEPHAPTLEDLLRRYFQGDAHAVLEDMVLTVSDVVRRPKGVEGAVAATQFQNRDRRYRGDHAVRARRRRRA